MLFNNKIIDVLFDDVNFSLDIVLSCYGNNFLELNLKNSNYILFNLRSNSTTLHNLFICSHSLNCKNKIVSCNGQHIQKVFTHLPILF